MNKIVTVVGVLALGTVVSVGSAVVGCAIGLMTGIETTLADPDRSRRYYDEFVDGRYDPVEEGKKIYAKRDMQILG